jgi:hypothetical protein
MGGILSFVITLLVMGLIFWLVIWLIDWIAVPEPFNKVIKAVVGIALIIYLVSMLGGFTPMPIHGLMWR